MERTIFHGTRRATGTYLCAIVALVLAWALVGNSLAAAGEVLSHQKISETEGGFTGVLDDIDAFSSSIAWLGDLDGDNVADIVVGAANDDDGGTQRGAVWVLFLNSDGTVKSHQKISDTEGGFTGGLDDNDLFGASVASLGDMDGDNVEDIVVGAVNDDGGVPGRGAVWVLFLNGDGTVKSHQKISDTEGDFTGGLDVGDVFGWSVASLGDLDGDNVVDIAVGAPFDQGGGIRRGSVWVLFLNSDGTVKSHQKIDDTEGGFTGNVDDLDYFGSSVASLGDLDGDTVGDIVVGARGCDDGGITRGAVWVLFLNSDGTVKSHQKISDTQGGFAGTLDDHDEFGSSSASLADLNGDGVDDIAVGTPYDDDGGDRRGAVWVLFLNSDGTVKSHQKISDTEGGFTGTLDDADWYGWSVASLGDLNGDNMDDIAVGAIADDDGGSNQGAVWVLFLDGEVPTQLALDIKPELCPNSLNIKIFDMEPPPNAKSSKGGVLPVAVLGGDVSEIDVSSVHLEGVAPVRHSYEDVAAPVQDGEECECTTAGPDGYTDLTLKFEKSEIAAALGPVSHGDVIPLTLTGELLDGTPFEVTDCVSILHKDLGPPTPLFSEDDRIVLRRPVPNPFNPVTRISYVLPGEDFVRLSVYDVSGKLVDQLVARTQPAGEHIIEWDAKDLPSGIYFCRIQVGNLTEARKMILLK